MTTPEAGQGARCETHGHLYGYAGDRIRACIFCGTLRKSSLDTPPPPEPGGESRCRECGCPDEPNHASQAETIRLLAQQDARIAADQETIRQCDKELAEFREDLLNQAETIRQLEGRIKELEQERDFCAETVQLFQGNEGRETIRQLEGTLATWDHVMQRLEGEVARLTRDRDAWVETSRLIQQRAEAAEETIIRKQGQMIRAGAAEETIRKQGQMIRDLTIAADASEQRAEAAEGRVREARVLLERIKHHCEVAATHSAIYTVAEKALAALTPSPATGEGA